MFEYKLDFSYRWRFKTYLKERFGAKCRVLRILPRDRIEVEFEDGLKVIVSRMSVHRKED